MVAVKGRQCIVLSTKSNGVQYNRRLNFRLSLDVQGTLKGQKIIVHDLSSTGISFYVRKENSLWQDLNDADVSARIQDA